MPFNKKKEPKTFVSGNISTNTTTGISTQHTHTLGQPVGQQPLWDNSFAGSPHVVEVEGLKELATKLGVEGKDRPDGPLVGKAEDGMFYNIMKLLLAHVKLMEANPDVAYTVDLTPMM